MTVVVGYSPDVYGRAALEHGVRQVERDGGNLVVVNSTRNDVLVDRRSATASEITELTSSLTAQGIAVDVRHDYVDDVADSVVDIAEELDASLIVIGIRRRSLVAKALLGSVAQRILLEAHCPVLAVKPSE